MVVISDPEGLTTTERSEIDRHRRPRRVSEANQRTQRAQRFSDFLIGQNDPSRFGAFNPPSVFSVSFDSLAPARLTPSGPTFGCSSSKVPSFPVVVNSAGFGFLGHKKRAASWRPFGKLIEIDD